MQKKKGRKERGREPKKGKKQSKDRMERRRKQEKRLKKSTKIKTKKNAPSFFFLGRFYSTSVFLTSNNRHIQFKYVKRKMHHHLPLT